MLSLAQASRTCRRLSSPLISPRNMGTYGLWNYLNKHGLCKQTSRNREGHFMKTNHLLLDMNAVIHATLRESKFSSDSVIRDVVEAVRKLVLGFPPSDTLVLVFDGATPVAKIRTQKERRSAFQVPMGDSETTSALEGLKYNHDYARRAILLDRAEIITGSEFLLACEDALREALISQLGSADGGASDNAPRYSTVLSGCDEAGEGELKIASFIRRLWIRQRRTGTYTGDDAFVLVGNDSDLALVAIAGTPYRNYSIISPNDYSMTAIAELFEHWRKSVPTGTMTEEFLPSYRIDFVFILLLGGCDLFEGIGDTSVLLWRRYRDLRANGGYFNRSLVHGGALKLDVELLYAASDAMMTPSRTHTKSRIRRTLPRSSTVSKESAANALRLLKATLWALASILHGQCVDYGFLELSSITNIGSLKAAAAMKAAANLGVPKSSHPLPCLSPLEQCVAVLGRRGRFSTEIQRVFKNDTNDNGLTITRSTSVSYLVKEVRNLITKVDTSKLTRGERQLLMVQHGSLGDREEAEGVAGNDCDTLTFGSFSCAVST
ncbi:hypothetical protein TRVL_03131 [Trypanosoma vivax]|nr:hypothetical protein TRVL_03131 [Trypanosoma vivax]